jgi:hypothetical protein
MRLQEGAAEAVEASGAAADLGAAASAAELASEAAPSAVALVSEAGLEVLASGLLAGAAVLSPQPVSALEHLQEGASDGTAAGPGDPVGAAAGRAGQAGAGAGPDGQAGEVDVGLLQGGPDGAVVGDGVEAGACRLRQVSPPPAPRLRGAATGTIVGLGMGCNG